ncbi:hypothetical protein [Dictyobacter formicarum]|uniref:hypothetical protein n=1 Tax=Dictyobacter formicarum TaxID=2778368 RepID=UPI0019162F14|nr:hypothetical protein [Dictyobacter formicarum]
MISVPQVDANSWGVDSRRHFPTWHLCEVCAPAFTYWTSWFPTALETPSSTPERTPLGDAPYPPPQRACYVCGETCWRRDPDRQQYVCASNNPEHTARASWPWLIPTKPTTSTAETS